MVGSMSASSPALHARKLLLIKEKQMKQATLKPFNLEQAITGKPIVCRDGTPAKFLYYDKELNISCRVGAAVEGQLRGYCENGNYFPHTSPTDCDLFMASEKKRGWVNVYKRGSYHEEDPATCGGRVFSSQQDAIKNAVGTPLSTIEIHWEE